MVQIQAATGLPTVTKMDRTKRQAQQTYGAEPHYAGGSAPGSSGNPQGGSCCTCQVGPPGPPVKFFMGIWRISKRLRKIIFIKILMDVINSLNFRPSWT